MMPCGWVDAVREPGLVKPLNGVRAVTAALVAAALVAPWDQAARSEPTIRIIDPFAPGGPEYVTARLLSDQIARQQGLSFVIENRPGAGSAIGTEAASRARPDGNTLLVTSPAIIINAQVRKLGYDPLTSFEPVCLLVSSPNVIAVNSASPYHSLAELLDAARAMPGDLTLASVGPATSAHIAIERLKRLAQVNMTFIPYSGAPLAVNALLGDHVTAFFGSYPNVAVSLSAGKLRALATASRTRVEMLREVPTIAESGYQDYEADLWFGMFAPAKTSKDMVSRLAGWFSAALEASEIKAKLVAQGLYPVGMCGGDFATYLRKQYDDYGGIIRDANIKVE
jgi:tripartite-type tricarboxylate transporter receptor subunit TctC